MCLDSRDVLRLRRLVLGCLLSVGAEIAGIDASAFAATLYDVNNYCYCNSYCSHLNFLAKEECTLSLEILNLFLEKTNFKNILIDYNR